GPCRHRMYGTRWTIAVVDLEREAVWGNLRLHALERCSDLLPQNAFGRFVTGKRAPDEIVMARIPHVLGDARIDIAQIAKAERQGALCMREVHGRAHHECGGSDEPSAGNPHRVESDGVTRLDYRELVWRAGSIAAGAMAERAALFVAGWRAMRSCGRRAAQK